jgi:hypothetical protein
MSESPIPAGILTLCAVLTEHEAIDPIEKQREGRRLDEHAVGAGRQRTKDEAATLEPPVEDDESAGLEDGNLRRSVR